MIRPTIEHAICDHPGGEEQHTLHTASQTIVHPRELYEYVLQPDTLRRSWNLGNGRTDFTPVRTFLALRTSLDVFLWNSTCYCMFYTRPWPNFAHPLLSSILAEYVCARLSAISSSYQMFRDNHLQDDAAIAVELKSVRSAVFGISLSAGEPLRFDRKLFCAYRHQKIRIIPMTPLVRQIALAHLRSLELRSKEPMASSTLQSPIVTNDAKGRIIAAYIIDRLPRYTALFRRFTFFLSDFIVDSRHI